MKGKTSITLARTREILQALREGSTQIAAMALAGYSRPTLYAWREHARKGDEPYTKIIEEMDIAEGAALASAEASIGKAWEGGDWRAAAWALERRNRPQYGAKVEIATRVVPPEEIDDAELARLAFGPTEDK